MKYTALFILTLLLTFSCKQEAKDAIAKEKVTTKKNPADLSDLYQYYQTNPVTLDQKDENQIIEYLADKNLPAVRTKSGVYIHTAEKGGGAQVKWGDPISVDYNGAFLDGEKFDSSYDRGEPISFRVGNMNAGWNEALPYLTRGTKATFYIPSHMGYGKKGFPGFVGPDMILVFDVHIFEEEVNK